jgi:hypothetical protein
MNSKNGACELPTYCSMMVSSFAMRGYVHGLAIRYTVKSATETTV